MKIKSYLSLISFLFIFFALDAQVVVSFGNAPAGLKACDSFDLPVTINNLGSPILDFGFGIDPGNEFELVSNGTCTTTSVGIFELGYCNSNLPSGITNTSIPLNVLCEVIPNGVSPNPSTLNFSIPGQCFEAVSTVPNAIGNSPVANIDVEYPFLSVTNPANIQAHLGQTISRTIVLTNLGSPLGTFQGEFNFDDNLGGCTALLIDHIDVFIGSNPVPQVFTSLNFSVNLTGSPILSTWHPSLPNISDCQITIVEYFDVVECTQAGCTSTYTINYGCTGDPCRQIIPFTATVTQGSEEENIIVTRVLPVDGVNPGGTYYGCDTWISICPEDIVHWHFRVRNVGNWDAYGMEINLAKTVLASMDYVFENSILINGLPAVPDCSESMAASYNFNPATYPNCLTDNLAQNPINWATFAVGNIAPGDVIDIEFDTYRCCMNDEVFFNVPKSVNYWQLRVRYSDECTIGADNGPCLAPAPVYIEHNPSGALIPAGEMYPYCSTVQSISTHQSYTSIDLQLIQNFSPPVSHMNGVIGGCGDTEIFQLENLNFFPFDYDHQLVGPPNGLNPGGQLKIEFEFEQGLYMLNITPADVFMIHGLNVWNYFSFNPLPPTPGYPTRYEAIFDFSNFPTFNALNAFVQGSFVNFPITSCCPAEQPTVGYRFRTYINLSPGGACQGTDGLGNPTYDCWIPMAQHGNEIAVHCPGCIIPGIIVDSYQMVRDPVSYGSTDLDNDGREDLPATPITGAPALLNRSIASDILNSTTIAHFEDGAGCPGFTYDQWQAVWNPLGTFMDHLYLELIVPSSEDLPNEVNLTPLTASITIIPSNTLFPTFTCNIPIGNIQRIGENYFFDLSLSNLTCAPPGYVFETGDVYQIDTQFQFCRNFRPVDPNNPVNNTHILSSISANMYLSSGNYSTPAWSNVQSAVDANGQNCDPAILDPDLLYWCETFGNFHHFYSTETYNSSGWDNDAPTECTKRHTATAVVRLGGGQNNIFPFEYRRAPVHALQFDFDTPAGYEITAVSSHTSARVYDIFPYSAHNYTLTDPILFNPIGTNIFSWPNSEYVNFTSAIPFVGANIPYPDLVVGDEQHSQSVTIDMRPVQCVDQVDPSAYNTSTIQISFPELGCLTGTEIFNNSAYNGVGQFSLPNPQLSIFNVTGMAQATSSEVCWEVQITNAFGADMADNVFIHFDAYPNIVISTIQCITNGCQNFNNILTPNADGFFELGNIAPNQICSYLICGTYSPCTNPGDVHTINFDWGFQCFEYPTSLTDPYLCDVFQNSLSLTEMPANLYVQSESLPANYVLCDSQLFTGCLYNPSPGNIYDFILDITLPPNLILDIAASSVVSDLNTYGLSTFSFVSCGIGCSSFDLTSIYPSTGTNGLSSNENICFNLVFIPQCGYDGTLPLISVNAQSYCGADIGPVTFAPNQWSNPGNLDNCTPACNPCDPSFTTTLIDDCCYLFTNAMPDDGVIDGCPRWRLIDPNGIDILVLYDVYELTYCFTSPGNYQLCLDMCCEDGSTLTHCEDIVIGDQCGCADPTFFMTPIGECCYHFEDPTVEETVVNGCPRWTLDGPPGFTSVAFYDIYELDFCFDIPGTYTMILDNCCEDGTVLTYSLTFDIGEECLCSGVATFTTTPLSEPCCFLFTDLTDNPELHCRKWEVFINGLSGYSTTDVSFTYCFNPNDLNVVCLTDCCLDPTGQYIYYTECDTVNCGGCEVDAEFNWSPFSGNGCWYYFYDLVPSDDILDCRTWTINGDVVQTGTTTLTYLFPCSGLYYVCYTDCCIDEYGVTYTDTVCHWVQIEDCCTVPETAQVDFTIEGCIAQYCFVGEYCGDLCVTIDWGDGTSPETYGIAECPSHTYDCNGAYEVCWQIYCCNTFSSVLEVCKDIIITDCPCDCGSDFTWSCAAGLGYQFVDLTPDGNPNGCEYWEVDGIPYPDGDIFNFTFPASGGYTICHFECCSNSPTTGPVYSSTCYSIMITPCCCLPDTFTFTSCDCTVCVTPVWPADCAYPGTVIWDYGDGSPLTTDNCHTYAQSGNYNISMNFQCEDDLPVGIDMQTVSVVCPCRADADFNWSIITTDGCTVAYTNLSTYSGGTSVSYLWEFGDGATATTFNAGHTYSGPGPWIACLTVTVYDGDEICDVDTYCEDFTLPDCEADCDLDASWFAAKSINDCLHFYFTGMDNGLPSDCWIWDFGDGTSGVGQNIQHDYPIEDNYWVCLTVCCGDQTQQICDWVNVTCPPVPECAVVPMFQQVELEECTFQFTDFSVPAPGFSVVAWEWDFGGQGTSTDQNPVFTFSAPGTYIVCLTVTAANEDEICSKSFCWEVTCGCVGDCGVNANFSWNQPTHHCWIDFTDLSTANPGVTITDWNWDFDGLGSSTDQNPQFTFPNSGSYPVTLTITGIAEDGTTCTSTITILIEFICDPCFAEVSIDGSQLYQGDEVTCTFQFYSTVSGASADCSVSYLWNFGDGSTSTMANPIHTFPGSGGYWVCLTVTVVCGEEICYDTFCKFLELECPCTCSLAEPAFQINQIADCTYELVYTENLDPCLGIVSLWWSPGDGNTIFGNPATYSWPGPGEYEICLHMIVMIGTKQCELKHCEMFMIDCINEDPKVLNLPLNEDSPAFTVAPNPNTGEFNFYSYVPEESEYQLVMTDAYGHQVMHLTAVFAKGSTSRQIDLNGVAGGMYSLVITNGKFSQSIKIVVQN